MILQATRRWVCPNCTLEQTTHEPQPHTRFHTCPGLQGLTAPMVEAGTKCEVYAVERDDYIGADKVQLHNGRPVMAVITKRETGQDVAVFAPTATASSSSMG